MEKNTVPTTKSVQPKQVLALAVLSLLLVGIGIWQWQSLMGGTAPQQNQPSKPSSGNEAKEPSSETALATTGSPRAPFAPRDPFRPYSMPPSEQGTKVVAQRPAPSKSGNRVPPIPPLTLPAPGALRLEPKEEHPETPSMPKWALTGVVQGPRTLAILKDSAGNRRFVRQGDVLEEGWRVHRIERGTVVLKKANEQITLQVGQSTDEAVSRESGGRDGQSSNFTSN